MGQHFLFGQLCQFKTLLKAWKQVRAKGSAGGIDGQTIEEADRQIGKLLQGLISDLRNGQWKPQPYLRISIPKKNNERRKLGLLTVRDKIVQQAIKQVTESRFERLFVKNSYGYRPDKGHTKAIRYAWHCCRQESCAFALRLDIDNYFDTIDHELLFRRMLPVVGDEEVARLIRLSVQMGVVNKRMQWENSERGVPQGGVLSPLLANLYLHAFDQFVLTKSDGYVRYADDFIIFCPTKENAEQLLESARTFLKERLKLTLNEPSITEVKEGVEFLGITLYPDKLRLSEKKLSELLEKIKSLDWQETHFDAKGLRSLQGIKRYYATLLPEEYLLRFDEALEQRLRQIIQERWRLIPDKKVLEVALGSIEFYGETHITKMDALNKELLGSYTDFRAEHERQQDKDQNARIVKQRKAEYRKKENEGTELIVSSPGVFIGVSQRGLTLKSYGKQQPLPPANNLQHVLVIGEGVSLSSNVIAYCMERRIPVDFFSASGKLIGSMLSPTFMETTLWKQQASLADADRVCLAKRIIEGKLRNQFNLIKYYHKYHKNKFDALSGCYAGIEPKLKALVERLNSYEWKEGMDYRADLMGIEAAVATLYWEYIRALVADDDVGFLRREQQGATDLMNCMLNYGYAILYGRVWQALLAYKLNPSDSFIHAHQLGKPTFVYDVIELFRAQAVDRVVVSLIQKREPLVVNKGMLSDDTLRLLSKHIVERLNRYETYRGKEYRLCDIIRQQVKEIATFITDRKSYRPYIAKW